VVLAAVEAEKLAWVGCRAKDLVHIAVASLMRRQCMKCVLAADVEDLEKAKGALGRELGLEVRLVHPPRTGHAH
jgi:hypothetical protein